MTGLRFTQRGFTLVEVLIASAITVGSLGVLLGLFASSLDKQNRIQNLAQRIVVEREVVTRISRLNPAQQTSGEGEIGVWRYQWKANSNGPFQRVTNYFPYDGPTRSVSLFKVTVELSNRENNRRYVFDFDKVGWRS